MSNNIEASHFGKVGTMRSVRPEVGTVTTTGKRSASLGETSVGGGGAVTVRVSTVEA